jgi:death-on-curing protein
MSLSYLNVEEILRLHFQVIEEFGGSHGVRDEGRLKSVVVAPRQEVFGEQQYPTIHEKAAVYLRNIIEDRPFVNGNKRIALTVCGVFLARNNIQLTASPKDLENFTVQVSTDHLKVSDIASWLKSHSN